MSSWLRVKKKLVSLYIASDVFKKFDMSNFPEDHPSGIATDANKKIIGMFKNEAGVNK